MCYKRYRNERGLKEDPRDEKDATTLYERACAHRLLSPGRGLAALVPTVAVSGAPQILGFALHCGGLKLPLLETGTEMASWLAQVPPVSLIGRT